MLGLSARVMEQIQAMVQPSVCQHPLTSAWFSSLVVALGMPIAVPHSILGQMGIFRP